MPMTGQGCTTASMPGVASIEHGIQLDDDAIRKMVAKGTYLVPTLQVYCCTLEKEISP